jgi:ribosomal protein S18 acetylase RimI-like enzyme
MIELTHATSSDIPELIELWNVSFGPAFPMTDRLMRQTLDHDPYYEPDGNFIIRQGGKIVAWALCKSMKNAGPELGRFQGRGGIGALCVHPDYRRRGLATALLDTAEKYLETNGSPVTTLYYPHHFLPGIPAENDAALALFRKRGYTGFRECTDLMRDLEDYAVPEKCIAAMERNPEVEVRPAHSAEADAIVSMVSREFPGGWTYSTKGHFERGGAPSDIIVAVEHDEIIGFCHTADWKSKWLIANVYWHPLLGERYGGLGPVGIAAAHRKRGLGLALTALSVADLQGRGVERMAIDWTNLVDFYGLLGFTPWKRYLQAERPV